MTQERFRVRIFIFIFCLSCCNLSDTINISPNQDYFMPYNSAQNVSYTCVGNDRRIFLTVIVNGNKNQLQSSQTIDNFASKYGINVTYDVQRPNVLTFTVTSVAWTALLAEFRSPVELVFCCQAFDTSRNLHSSNHTIVVYGPLEAPNNITLTSYSKTELQLSWIGPDVPGGVNITYQIHMISISTGFAKEFNTSECFIDIDITGVCDNFNFTITAYDDHGGLSSVAYTMYNISSLGPDVSNIVSSLNTIVEKDKDVSFLVKFEPATVCDGEFAVINYTLVLEGITSITVPASTRCGDYVCMSVCDSVISEAAIEPTINCSITACTILACVATGLFTVFVTPGIMDPHSTSSTTEHSEDSSPSYPHKIICCVIGALLCLIASTVIILLLCWCVSRKCKRKDNTKNEHSRANCPPMKHSTESTLYLAPQQATTKNRSRTASSPHVVHFRSDNIMTSGHFDTESQLSNGPLCHGAQSGVDSVSIQMENEMVDNGGPAAAQESSERQNGEISVVVTNDGIMLSTMTPSSCIQTCIPSPS